MDTNEKKPKRPRIGQPIETESNQLNHFEKVSTDFRQPASSEGDELPENPRPYRQPYNPNRQQGSYNTYNRQGGYNNYNRQGGGYGQQRHYQQRPYNNTNNVNAGAEGEQNGENQTDNSYNNGYNRSYNNNRQGGYNNYHQQQQNGYHRTYNNHQQGGYQPRQQGGYNNAQGGYQPRQQGGYNNRQGGYNNNRQQGGYNNRQGGYQPRQQGGYNNNRQGGYNNNRPMNNRFNPNRQQNGAFQARGKSFTPRPKRIEYEMPVPAPDEQIRLNKFLANAGLCSRREADEYIQSGKVLVNGKPATELGTKITHSDVVEYDGKVVTLESKCYILLNKPKDCVTTSDDPNGRLTVLDLVKGACDERIYPVGRLDRNTTGVLLLTNDGDLASKLTHPQYVKKKIYHVWTDKNVTEDDMQRIADGIELEDGEIHADAISYATENDRNQIGIEIHSGRNRIVRRIFESLGYHVTKLDRVYFAGLTKKNLPRGRWRYLTQQEVNFLKMGSFE